MSPSNDITLTTVTFAVQGMRCGSCVRHIDQAIRGRFPTATAQVDLAAKQVAVTFDPATASGEAIAETLEAEGYPARPLSVSEGAEPS